jgi:uncharacterized protein (DUF58 family)
LVDAALASRSLEGIRVELAPVTRLSKNREGQLELRVRNDPLTARRLRLGLSFPPEIHSVESDRWTTLPGGVEQSRLRWPCTGLKRGLYRLEACFLEGVSPLGFWAMRGVTPARAEIRVYPDLVTDRKNLAALFLNRGALGLHSHRQVGKGREFEKLREYVPGDGYDEIHWKATAKRGHPITKVFQIERTQEVYVIIDASRLSTRGVWPAAGRGGHPGPTARGPNPAASPSDEPFTSMFEQFITAALVLGLVAERQGDLFGLLTFSDKVLSFMRAKGGPAHFRACRDTLYTLQPQAETPDFDDVFTFIRLRLRRRALLVFLTSLDDPVLAEGFVRHVDLICRHHLVLVNMLQPPGVEPLFAQSSVSTPDDLYTALGGHLRWHELRELGKVLQRHGVRFAQLEPERMAALLVSQYLSVKQRQLL